MSILTVMERYNPYAAGHVKPIGETENGALVWEVVVAQTHVVMWLKLNGYRYGEHNTADGTQLAGWIRGE